MNNFHYRNAAPIVNTQKSTKLMKELQSIDRQIDMNKRKLAEKQKLQEQFYQDASNRRQNLADEIFNELLNERGKQKNNQLQQKNVQNVVLPSRNNAQDNQWDFYDQKLNFNNRQQTPPVSQMPKKNPEPIINNREMQKLKLQNKNAQQQFPFGGNSRQKDRRTNALRQSPERQPPFKNNYIDYEPPTRGMKKDLSTQQLQNPFIKNDEFLRKKREEQERNYRRVLQQQRQQQLRRKQQQRQKHKQQIQQKFNSYTPAAPTGGKSPTNEQKANVENPYKKKRDPNGQYAPFQKQSSEIRPSDLQFMKMQVNDIKNKFKRGRINHEEYDAQIKKLQNHYKCKIDEAFMEQNFQQNNQRNGIAAKENLQQKINQVPIKNNSQKFRNVSGVQQLEKKQKQLQISSNKNKSLNNDFYGNPYTTQPIPVQYRQSQAPPITYSNYQQPPIIIQNPQPDSSQYQYFIKIFEELKGIIKMQNENQMNILNDKKNIQQQYNKMLKNNPYLMTQQILGAQLPTENQRQYQTDKKVQRFDSFPRNNIQGVDYSMPQSGESQISSSYIQKSLSGIVNKIPLTKKQKQQQKKQDASKDIAKFYERKYKIKKFKGFQYVESDNQNTNIIIPSLSNYLQTKNSQIQLTELFQKDIADYKKMQKQRQLQMLKMKIKKDKQSENQNRSNKYQVKQQTQPKYKVQNPPTMKVDNKQYRTEQQQQKNNPFLKKHVSGEQNHPITFTQNKFNQIIKSPTAKSPQILEQQQYQTQPRKSKSPPKRQQNKRIKQQSPPTYGQKGTSKDSSNRLLNIMKTNNQILSKYEQTPARSSGSNIGSNSLSSIKQMVRADQSKQISSREYFSGHDISPVVKRQRDYESSLETVRSQQQSVKMQRRHLLVSAQQPSQLSSHYEQYHHSPIPSIQSIPNSPTVQSIQISRKQQINSNKLQQNARNIISQSQTVESVDESQSKLPSFQKPPGVGRKNSRSTSRKKQSVIRVGSSDNFQKSALSGIPSEGSKQKISSLLKPPSYSNQENKVQKSDKFDSAIYQSGYEQSISQRSQLRSHASPPHQSNESGIQRSKYQPPTFKQVLQRPFIQKPQQIRQIKQKSTKRYQEQGQNYQPQTKIQQNQGQVAAPKWKSLQQARKLAKQFRLKSGEDHNRSSVEQKLSQLQSIINTSKKQQSIIEHRSKRQEHPQTSNKKKDIMKLLDDLGEDEYQDDFNSYKEESQR